jgi:hypothetical protein
MRWAAGYQFCALQPPQWEDLDAWMRDAITAAYQQGTLDGAPRRLSEKEGFLRMQPSGRWAVCRFGREPVEITSGELFRVEVPGKLAQPSTRMEYRPHDGGGGEYYSVDGYELRDGLRAAIGAEG